MKVFHIALIGFFLAFMHTLSAQENTGETKQDFANDFAQAYTLQSEGKNAAAIEIYENIISSNTLVSAQVFNNLGLAYLAENKISNAVLNFAKAIKYAPHLTAPKQNLLVAQSRVKEAPIVPKNAFKDLFVNMSAGFSANGWFFMALVFSLLTAASFFYIKQAILRGAIAVLMLYSIVMGFVAKDIASTEMAVIMHDKVMLKQAADLGAANAGQIYEGTIMEVIDRQGDWVRILLADGVAGWIPSAMITII